MRPVNNTIPVRPARIALAVAAVLLAALAALAATATSAFAFGTVNFIGQAHEHELITRAALSCRADNHPRDCFHPWSASLLAGKWGSFGAVGGPDSDEIPYAPAHCDDSDYLPPSIAPGYPQTRADADAALLQCRKYAFGHISRALVEADRMLDNRGRLIKKEVEMRDCTFTLSPSGPAKCMTLNDFGRTLHTGEDFYSHTNWADQADPSKPLSIENPPGLNQSGLTSLFDWDAAPVIPPDLTGGCYRFAAKWECNGHLTHSIINKDEGTIDPVTGEASAPRTPRGQIGSNFQKAVTGAVNEARRQWTWFTRALRERYGDRRANLMICALTHDHPFKECQLKLTISGTETVQWTDHTVLSGQCGGTSDGSGQTVIRFSSTGPVYASPVDLVTPDSATDANGGVQLPTSATIDSHGSSSAVPSGQGCGSNSGPPPAPDCGQKTISLPLQVISLSPDTLTLRNWGATPADPYKQCDNGALPRTAIGPDIGPLNHADLFDDTVKMFQVTGHGHHLKVTQVSTSDLNGTDTVKVSTDWTLTIERQDDSQLP